jgi:chemotaxis protein MotB
MARKKKRQEEEHENLERWLVSYADFITLLFAFFVTMYAISRVDEKKMGSVVESLQRALGSTTWQEGKKQDAGVFPISDKPVEVAIVPVNSEKGQGKDDFEKLAAEIKKNIKEGQKDTSAESDLNQLKFIQDKR